VASNGNVFGANPLTLLPAHERLTIGCRLDRSGILLVSTLSQGHARTMSLFLLANVNGYYKLIINACFRKSPMFHIQGSAGLFRKPRQSNDFVSLGQPQKRPRIVISPRFTHALGGLHPHESTFVFLLR
jgi:hypothetical protein